MAVITLRDIQRIAEQESSRHMHFYIGVEHLFIAMTKLQNGMTNAVLEYVDIEPRFIRYSIRQEIGTGEDGRYWSGFRQSPRAQLVTDTAQKYAGIHTATEQHVLLAIIDEGDSIPTRILAEHKVDLDQLRLIVDNWSPHMQAEIPPVPIEITAAKLDLDNDERIVLQRMFRAYQKVTVERELGGSYTGARLLVVRPQRNQRNEALVVVKIAERGIILHEQRHYETYVKNTFPPTTAHLLDTPALPENCALGGLKYALVKPAGSPDPINLQVYAEQNTPTEIGYLLREGVYKVYAESLWWERQRFRFGVWREYEHVLPPALEIDFIGTQFDGSGTVIEPMGSWSRQDSINISEIVILRNFAVQKVRYSQASMQVSAGGGTEAVNRASKVEVVNMGKTVRQFRRGEVIEFLVGRVQRRRTDILQEQIALLDPPFKLHRPGFTHPFLGELPNPLQHVSNFLEKHLRGYLSIIHGDLHLGNILVGPGGDAWLIDFALVREGHTLFDWAMLEVSVLCTIVAPRLEAGWQGIWRALYLLHQINNLEYHMNWDETPLADAFRTIAQLREIVADNLTRPDRWHEYHTALMMLALRGVGWTETTTIQTRRLLFGVAAMSIFTTQQSERGELTTHDGTHEMPTDTHHQLPPDLTSDNLPPSSDSY